MRVCTCFLLFRIFAYTHSFASNTPRDKKRTVNLALETVLEFSDKDKAGDLKLLNNVQNFITKVKTVIDKSNVKSDFRRDFKAPTATTFTGFIQKVINILNTYENTKLTAFFEILDEEIRKYHYRGCKFYELTENYEIRKQIAAKLDSIKSKPASEIKADINVLSETLKNVNNDINIKEIVDYINSLYRQDAREKFQNVLTDLQAHGKSKLKTKLGETIKNSVRLILFDHYTNLNTNVRRDVKQKIETFWKRFNPPSMGNIPNGKTSDNVTNEGKKLKPVSRKHTASAEIKQSDYKYNAKRHDLKLDKKQYKNTRKDTIGKPLKVHEKNKRILSPQRPKVQQRNRTETQEQSSSVNTLSSESLEFYKEPKDKTQRYNVISKNVTTNSRKKSKKIRNVNLTTRTITNHTVPNIWIEESTGRLPKSVLDKLANKSRGQEPIHNATEAVKKHGPKYNKKYGKGKKSWHGKIYELKHGKEYDKKSDIKRTIKHRPYKARQGSRQKLNEDKKLKPEKKSKLSNKELHQYKNSMGPSKMELSHANRWSAVASKSQQFLDVMDVPMIPAKSDKTIKSLRVGRTAATKKLADNARTQRLKYNETRSMKAARRTSAELEQHKELSKKNQMLSWKFARQANKSLEIPSSYSEGMTVEQFEIKDGENTRKQAHKTVTSLEKDVYVINKLRNLERELEKVKSSIKEKAEVKHNEPKEKKEISELSETKTGSDVNMLINDSKFRQVQLETARNANNQTELSDVNKHIPEIGSKYNDIKDNIQNSKSGINVNADVEKVVKLQQSGEPTKLQPQLSKTKLTPPGINRFDGTSADTKLKQDKPEVKGTADNKIGLATENTYVQQLVSKYKKMVDNLEKGQNVMNVSADILKENINDFEKKQDELLQMAESNKKESLIEPVKDKKIKNKDKGKKLETTFRSGLNIISNEFKDRKEKSKVTKTADSKMDIIVEEIKNKNNSSADVTMKLKARYLEQMRDRLLHLEKTTTTGTDKDKKPETNFRSDLNMVPNNFKNGPEKPKVARLASNREDEKSKNNEVKDNKEDIKSKINVNANVVKTTKKTGVKNLPQHKEHNKGNRNLVKTRHRSPHINRFILDSLPRPPQLTKTAGDKNELLAKDAYIQKFASKYKQIMADVENDSSGMNANAGTAQASVSDYGYEPKEKHREYLPMPKDIKSLKAYNNFEEISNRLLNMEKIKPVEVKETNTKVNNINKGIEAERSRNLQERTEIAQLTETADERTNLFEKAKMKEETVGNDNAPVTVTEKQAIIIRNDVSPEKKDAAIEMTRFRAGYDASKGTGTSTEASKPSTETTITAAATTPTTLELLTTIVFLPEATSTRSPYPRGTLNYVG